MNGAWGFNLQDTQYKSTRDLVHLLVKAAGYDANLLLNVGPMPNGKIQPEFEHAPARDGGFPGQRTASRSMARAAGRSPRATGG